MEFTRAVFLRSTAMKAIGGMMIAAVLLAVSAAGVAADKAPPAAAGGKVCQLEIAGNDLMQYDKTELKVAGDCAQVELTLKHTGKLPAATMGHNWVLTKDADAAGVANDGLAAGINNNHVKPGDTRVIAHTAVVGGGQSVTIKFPMSLLKKGEGYTYECTFPGHNALMHGKLIFG
jgi:azurin